jgi:hypothetical protein
MIVEHWWNGNWQGKKEDLGKKKVPVPFFPPQAPHGLLWDLSKASIVKIK